MILAVVFGSDAGIFLFVLHQYGPDTSCTKNLFKDFPGGPVIKNPPSNAGDAGLKP